MACKRMYYLVSIGTRKAYYKTYSQQNKERNKQRYTEQKLKLKKNEPSVETNEHNKPVNMMSKL